MAGKQFRASHRYARISARKVRPLAISCEVRTWLMH